MTFNGQLGRISLGRAAAAGLAIGVLAAAAPAYAISSLSSQKTVSEQNKLTQVKSRGDGEITRRLASLDKLSGRISSAKHLSATDKTALQQEVSSAVSGLNSLKTTLDGETALPAAFSEARSIATEYRVYALVLPKVWLVRTADDQQVVESRLTALEAKLQARITDAKNSGKDVTALQSALDDLKTRVSAAQAISSSVETKVLALQPSDFNTDHKVLGGYRDQLKTAHSDNQQAISDAKTIINGLKNL